MNRFEARKRLVQTYQQIFQWSRPVCAFQKLGYERTHLSSQERQAGLSSISLARVRFLV
jgi:hypothetical protein